MGRWTTGPRPRLGAGAGKGAGPFRPCPCPRLSGWKRVSDSPPRSAGVVCRAGLEAGSGARAGETNRGCGLRVGRGGGCARGTVGAGVRACSVDEMGRRGPCGGHDDASIPKGGEETGETGWVWRGRAEWFCGLSGGERRRGGEREMYIGEGCGEAVQGP